MKSFSLFNGRLDSIWEPKVFRDISEMVAEATKVTLNPLFTAANHGQETSVSDLLDRYASELSDDEKECPILLNPKFTYTDHVGRIFRDYTLLQYDIFNLDTPMVNLIKSYMHPDDAQEQMEAIRDGITYDMPRASYDRLMQIAPDSNPPIQLDEDSKEPNQDYVTLKEKHYAWGFRVFKIAMEKYIAELTAMQKYIAEVAAMQEEQKPWDYDPLRKLWLDVYFTQLFLPVPFINAYCSEELLFTNPPPNFHTADVKAKLARTDSYYSHSGDRKSWFADACSKDAGLDSSLSLYKGPQVSLTPAVALRRRLRASRLLPQRVDLDLAALSALYETLESGYNLAFDQAQAYSFGS